MSKTAKKGQTQGSATKGVNDTAMDDNDYREEMLYRSMDNIVMDTQTGGGDIAPSGGPNRLNISQDQIRRNSELNAYSEIAISDQKDGLT